MTTAALAVVVSACTPTVSRLARYRDDAGARAEVEARAAAVCRCVRGEADLPPHAFTTDGCSMSPDGDWADCCVEHDIAYWCGGNRGDRRQADRRLGDCVADRGHSRVFATFVRGTVFFGGQPCSPFPWRWGYGWDGVHGYGRSGGREDSTSCFDEDPIGPRE